ncbi:unnamed protein product [Symbiodinium natans]|uniref:PARP catalytic domain-containing protein n=1 Tax=Symbiodinium natans TaxID=878477 RepID=A0A812TE81_9DINO|nr:unnamed protein product [Symbiodinium natans]
MPIAMDLGLDGFGLEEDIPLRGWSMKRGHRKRVEAASCRKAKKSGKAGEQYEVGLGRSVTKRSVHSGGRHSWDQELRVRTRRYKLRQQMHQAINEIYEAAMEAECAFEDLEEDLEEEERKQMKEMEEMDKWAAKWEDLEVASVCTSTTAGGSEPASGVADFAASARAPSSPSRSSVADATGTFGTVAPSLSPWLAALRRAELRAREYADTMQLAAQLEREGRRRRQRLVPEKKSEIERLADELSRLYQVRLCHDQTEPLTPFEKLRWQFLKDHAHAICQPLSGCYLGTGRQWQLKPTPLAPAVEDRFLQACDRAVAGELQPALHGTNETNLLSIYSRGLLIPGESGIKVVNGSVHGVGIYTAYTQSAGLSWSYSRGLSRPVLVCGVLDPKARKDGADTSQLVNYTCSARIFFQEDMVSPLFEACIGSGDATTASVPRPTFATSKKHRLEPEPEKKPKGPGPRTRLVRRRVPRRSPQAFLARHAARKRQSVSAPRVVMYSVQPVYSCRFP